MREQIVAANWKQNGNRALCDQFADTARSPDALRPQLVICPPAVWIERLSEGLAGSTWLVGGQNCSAQSDGAFTGELSASMLKEAGASFCIVGHSERRALYGESDSEVALKMANVLSAGMRPILCVGESLEVRESGDAERFVSRQLQDSLSGISNESLQSVVVAYEPVWAIGTGVTASVEQVQSMHALIRKTLSAQGDGDSLPLLYGGSVKPGNAAELLALEDVDGALVGGASLSTADFKAIASSA